MAKITRYAGNYEAFGAGALAGERTTFGEETVSDDLTAQHTAAYAQGWRGAVAPSGVPTVQDFNALGFSLDQAIAYLHQKGIAEWDATQEYYPGSLCLHDGGLGPQVWMARSSAATGVEPSWSALFGENCIIIWQPWGQITLPPSDGVGPTPYVLEIEIDPDDGPFFTLQHALQAIAWSFRQPQGLGTTGTPSILITLPSGYTDESQHIIDGVDLSWVRVEHEDDEMAVARSGLTELVGDVAYGWMCAINGGRAPVVATVPVLDATGAGINTALFLAHGAGSVVQWEANTPAAPSAQSNVTWAVYATTGGRASVTGTGAAWAWATASNTFYATAIGEIDVARAVSISSIRLIQSRMQASAAVTVTGVVLASNGSELMISGALTAGQVLASISSVISATSIASDATGVTVGTLSEVSTGSATLNDANAPLVVNGGGKFYCAGALSATGSAGTAVNVSGAGSCADIGGAVTVDDTDTDGIFAGDGAVVRIGGAVSAASSGAGAAVHADGGTIHIVGTLTSDDGAVGVMAENLGQVHVAGAVDCQDHTDAAMYATTGGSVLCEAAATLKATSVCFRAIGGKIRIVGNTTVWTASVSQGVYVEDGGEAIFEGDLAVTCGASGLYAVGGVIRIGGNVDLTNAGGGAGNAIQCASGGHIEVQGTTTAPSAQSYTILCRRGVIVFSGTVSAANANNLIVIHSDGGHIRAGVLNVTGNTQPFELTVANGGFICRASGTGAAANAGNINANGYINV